MSGIPHPTKSAPDATVDQLLERIRDLELNFGVAISIIAGSHPNEDHLRKIGHRVVYGPDEDRSPTATGYMGSIKMAVFSRLKKNTTPRNKRAPK